VGPDFCFRPANRRPETKACTFFNKIRVSTLDIIRKSVSELSQDPANARTHDEKNISAIIASLRRFGQQHPIVIDSSGVVRAGNGRLEAAVRLGWPEIDCVVTDLKGSDAIAYAIADNRTSELAGWDDDVLAAQLQGLVTDDEALLEAAGFSEDDLAALLGDNTEQDNTEEIDPDGFDMECTCPRCGFEFDPK